MSKPSKIQPFAGKTFATAAIYVVEHDEDHRCAFQKSLEPLGEEVVAVASFQDFKSRSRLHEPGFAIVNAILGDEFGIDVIESLGENGSPIAAVLVLNEENVPLAVRACNAGALDVLRKPISPEHIRQVAKDALSTSFQRAKEHQRRNRAVDRISRLTPFQSTLLQHLVSGQTNRETAEFLEIGMRTVERTRAAALDKLGVRTLIEYVQLLHLAGRDESIDLEDLLLEIRPNGGRTGSFPRPAASVSEAPAA